MRVAAPCQLALGLGDLAESACCWQVLPEDTRGQVLGLLARLIARGALAQDLDGGEPVEADDAQ
jgi:hypothetical protein